MSGKMLVNPNNKTCVRPVMEYACSVFHDSSPNYLCEDLVGEVTEAIPSYHLPNVSICRSFGRSRELTHYLIGDKF
jgi:hypothetical protein